MADSSLSVERHPGNALSAFVAVRTDRPAQVLVAAQAAGHLVTVPVAGPPSCLHRVGLVGLRPGASYQVSARARFADGTWGPAGSAVHFRAGSLPPDFPEFRVTADPARMAPGLTLFNLVAWHPPARGRPAVPVSATTRPMLGYLVAVDEAGEVVWYYRCELAIEDARTLPDGSLLLNCDHSIARQIDPMGQPIREWASRAATEWMPEDELGRPKAGPAAVQVAADSMHHEVAMTSAGDLLFLSTELRVVDDRSGRRCAGRSRHEVIGDVVVEADSATGRVIQRWPLLDVLDPLERPGTRLCHGGLRTAPPAVFYRSAADPRDWSHANAAVVDERRNVLLVSLRHLDAVLALRYRPDSRGRAGELLWEFGPRGNVKLTDGSWAYHQHAAELHHDGSLLLYDNGLGRPGFSYQDGDLPPFSRAVLFDLDDEPGGAPPRASQRWEHRLWQRGAPVFCRRVGDADQLPNGNVLISHGNLTDRKGKSYARLVEVVPRVPFGGDIVFDMEITDSRDDIGWCVHRARRIPSLYPR